MESVQIKRVISLVPSITEIIYYLGLDQLLVGVTEHCNYPIEAVSKDKVGTFGNPELVKILSLSPDIVLADRAVHKSVIEELIKKNIKVIAFANSNIEEVFHSMYEIGKACGVENRANSFIKSLRNRVENLNRNDTDIRPRVFRLMSTNPFITPGKGSFQYDALKLAGAKLIDFNSNDSYIKVTLDHIKKFDPEIILFCGLEKGQIPKSRCKGCSAENPMCQRTIDDVIDNEWQDITAVKEGRVYPISCDILCRPGPRLIDGMEKLNKQYFKDKS